MAAIPPFHLLAESRGKVFLRIKEAISDGLYSLDIVKSIKKEEQTFLHRRWRRFVQNHTSFGICTKEAILPSFDLWIKRTTGSLSFRITQFLTAHGSFGTFLYRIGKRVSSVCLHCDLGDEDSPEHTLFGCHCWTEERRALMDILGPVSSLADIVAEMLSDQTKWSAVCAFANAVLLVKEEYEREMEGSLVKPRSPGIRDWDSDLDQ